MGTESTPDPIVEALRRIAELRNTRATALNLSRLGLTTLPPEIFSLTALQTLDLSGNKLVTLPGEISSLTALKALHLSYNRLTSLPPEIGSLTALQRLELDANRINTFPSELGCLKALQRLNLRGNELSALPATLASLSALRDLVLELNSFRVIPEIVFSLHRLERLWLQGNYLTALPSTIGTLKALQTLSLPSNELVTLPPEIGSLAALEDLHLADNRLTALPSEICSLAALHELDVCNNNLTTLPPEIAPLVALRSLDVRNNELKALPPEIGSLTALHTLHLGDNQLTTLPREIGSLTGLVMLDLHGNQLAALPREIAALAALNTLYLHGNPGLGLPLEVLGPGWDVPRRKAKPASPRAILDYYFRTWGDQGRALNEVKIMLVGRGGAGKTSLVRRLVENRFNSKEKETPGVSITDWELDCSEDKIKAHFWDFAGQEITHGTHQFFFTQRCVYLLLLTGREGTAMEDADYWLRMIEAFGGDAPVLVVLNKIEEHPFDVDETALRLEHPNIKAFSRMDCRSRAAHWRNDLLAAVRELVGGLDSVRKAFPGEWWQVKSRLSGMKKSYLTLEEYRQLCSDNGVKKKQDQDELAGWLHTLGIALNYADDDRVSHALVLNPRWITNGIYSILRGVEKAHPPGELRVAELKNWLPREKSEMRRYLVDLMQKYELCFALAEDKGEFLVPAVLPMQSPPLDPAWLRDAEAVRLRYEYSALPHGVIARFIVRTHRFIQGQLRWRYGVMLAWDGATALVRSIAGRDQIDIALRGPTADVQKLAAVVREHFENIHIQLKGLKPVEWIEVKPGSGLYERVAHLAEMEKIPGPVFVSSQEGPVEVNETEVLNQVEPESIRKHPPEVCVRVFVSYAHLDKALKEKFDVNLTILSHQKLIEPWTDRRIKGGEHWNEVIEANEREADLVIFLVSRNFLASGYIRKHEIPVALERKKEGVVIVPIILHKYDGWLKEPEWGELQPLPAWDKAIDDYPTAEKGFDVADAELRRVIEDVAKRLKTDRRDHGGGDIGRDRKSPGG